MSPNETGIKGPGFPEGKEGEFNKIIPTPLKATLIVAQAARHYSETQASPETRALPETQASPETRALPETRAVSETRA